MLKRVLGLLAICGLAAPLWAQPMAPTSLGAPLATVKLTKKEVVLDKSFRDDLALLEKARGTALTADERKAYLDDVINDLLFYQMCERDGIKVTEGEIDTYISKLRSQRPAGESDAQFSAFLATQGIPFEDLRNYYKKQVLIQRWLMTAKSAEIAAIKPIGIDDQEVLKTYQDYKARLVRPDTAKIAFLFFPFSDKSAAERTKGADIMKALSARLAKGESFDTLRYEADKGGYAANKEVLYFERGDTFRSKFGTTFYEMVFSMADGSNSIAFETEAGWWIVRRIEYFPLKQLELSDPYRLGQSQTVDQYIAQLLSKKQESDFLQKTFSDLFVKLRSQAEIKVLGTP